MMKPEEEIIVRRAARELRQGMVVNLGIGLPTLIPAVLPPGFEVTLHSENGFVGMGAPDPSGTRDSDTIDAGGRPVKLVPGAACFDSLMSFAFIRGGNLDLAVLGALEVATNGDLANWTIPGKMTPGIGGGMELAQKARRVVVLSRHLDKTGRAKLVSRCTLPLTARGCVDTLVTERAVFRLVDRQMTLVSIHPDHSRGSVMEGIDAQVPVAPHLEAW